jgi:uncharacterized OsmC-like protein
MYTATAVNRGDHRYAATATGFAFTMGQDAASPIDILLASLCACVAHHVRDGLVARAIAFSTLTVEAIGELTPDRMALERISVGMKVAGTSLSEAQADELVAWAGRCPIYNTLAKGTKIEVAIVSKPGGGP